MSTESLLNSAAIESDWHVSQENIVFPKRDPKYLAIKDIFNGLKEYRIWMLLAYQDIKLRYRRSRLGPFWITISMAVTAYSMGYLYGHLFHTDIASYFPFLVAGMLSWALISTSITDLVDAYALSEGLIKQVNLPYTLYIHKIAFRNMIVFFHNLIVIIPILFIFHESAKVNLNTLMLIPGLLLIYINSITFGTMLAMIGARFRDISQIVKSLVQVIFFVTPVMWQPKSLPPNKQYLVTLNPFYSFVDIVREPLIGKMPALSSFVMVFAVTAVCGFLFWQLFHKYRARIIYWL